MNKTRIVPVRMAPEDEERVKACMAFTGHKHVSKFVRDAIVEKLGRERERFRREHAGEIVAGRNAE